MYPFDHLPGNLTAFCRTLRVHGYLVGPGETADAGRALEAVGLADQERVCDALRPILSATREQAARFDRLFLEFFFPGPPGVPQPDQPATGSARRSRRPRRIAPVDSGLDTDEETAGRSLVAGQGETDQRDADEEQPVAARRRYSSLAGGDEPERVLLTLHPQWRDAARTFVRQMHVGLSRRWRPGRRGRRLDPRRTLRSSLQTGGEVLAPRWLHRVRRAPRFVIVIDGSRSMEPHARAALDLAVGLAGATMRVDVFTFSTGVRRVTRDVRIAAAGRPAVLDRLRDAWGGGTRIGASVAEVVAAMERRATARDAIVLVASDGLDVGEPQVLARAMGTLARRSAAIVWLNPLLDTEGYEPSAGGMRVARPYVTTFASVGMPADLARLARRVRLRAG